MLSTITHGLISGIQGEINYSQDKHTSKNCLYQGDYNMKTNHLCKILCRLLFEQNSNFELGMRRVFLNFHSPCFWAELTSLIFIGVKIFGVSTLMLTTQTGYY